MGKKPDKLRPDVAETAFRVMLEATGQADRTLPPEERTEASPEAARRGRKGGKAGGAVRARRLTAKQRSESARKAAKARWKNKPTN